MSFALCRMRAAGRNFGPMLEAISAEQQAVIQPARRWGLFFGLFGLASNELYLMAEGDVGGLSDRLLSLDSVADVETTLLEATVRPTSPEPLGRDGLYVFRFFEVANVDVEEIVAISKKAWESFETSEAYESEPVGLFRQSDLSDERGRMLLLTWYDGFESWTTSRKPDPAARDLFQRRHQLTEGTIAYATRLLKE
jgi:hypothetical protein